MASSARWKQDFPPLFINTFIHKRRDSGKCLKLRRVPVQVLPQAHLVPELLPAFIRLRPRVSREGQSGLQPQAWQLEPTGLSTCGHWSPRTPERPGIYFPASDSGGAVPCRLLEQVSPCKGPPLDPSSREITLQGTVHDSKNPDQVRWTLCPSAQNRGQRCPARGELPRRVGL